MSTAPAPAGEPSFIVQLFSGIYGFFASINKTVFDIASQIGWKWFITIILVLFLLTGAVVQSFKEKSIGPIVYEVGGRVVAADTILYETMNVLKNSPEDIVVYKDPAKEKIGFIETIKLLWNRIELHIKILSNFWFIFINFYLIYMLAGFMGNKDEVMKNLLVAIFFFVFIQMFFASALLNINLIDSINGETVPQLNIDIYKETQTDMQKFIKISKEFVPLKGTWYFITNIDHFIDPLYSYSKAQLDAKPSRG